VLSYIGQFFSFVFLSYIYGRITWISTESNKVITYVIRQMVSLGVSMKRFSRFKTSVRHSYGLFYFILVTLTISSINFTELRYFKKGSAVWLTSRRQHLWFNLVIVNSSHVL